MKAVLNGELAVPCSLQSAIAGLNSRFEVIYSFDPNLASGVDLSSPAQWASAQPRQDREVAAVRSSVHVPQKCLAGVGCRIVNRQQR